MSFLQEKYQTQKDIDRRKAASIAAIRESDAKRLEEEISAAMDSVIIPPVDDFRPPEVIASTANGPFDGGGVFIPQQQFASPPIEKTPEEQEGIAILNSLPETMRPAKFRQIHVDIKAEALKQKAALEKVGAKITDAINHCDDMIKCSELSLGIMDGKTPAKRTPPKKPATPTATTGKRRGRKPAAKVEEEKASPPNPAPGSTGE